MAGSVRRPVDALFGKADYTEPDVRFYFAAIGDVRVWIMTTYLFVTGNEFHPERVRAGADYWWSCSSTTIEDDSILVYVKGEGIAYEWRATSDAERSDEWKFACNVEHVRTFDPGISLGEIRELFSKKQWAAPYQNFRGYRSIRIPPEVARQLNQLR